MNDPAATAPTSHRARWITGGILLALVLATCREDTVPGPDPFARPSEQQAAVSADPCLLLDGDTMSRLVGVPLQHIPSYPSKCVYVPKEGDKPYLELTFGFGEGPVAMMAAGVIDFEGNPTGSNGLGIGVQSAQLGDEWLVRHGDDLVTMRVEGFQDPAAVVARVYAAIQPALAAGERP